MRQKLRMRNETDLKRVELIVKGLGSQKKKKTSTTTVKKTIYKPPKNPKKQTSQNSSKDQLPKPT